MKIKTHKSQRKNFIKAVVFLTFFSFLAAAAVSCDRAPDTTGTGIIIGEDGWLFDGESEMGDYTGKTLFTDEQLDSILDTVKAKRTFFAKTNTDFIIVIIPDKMNVYSDRLPSDIRAQKSEKTRVKQVYDYIKKNTRITTVDLSELFSRNSSAFDLYERTGSTLSDMGAYLVYTEIVKAVNSLNISKLNLADLDSFNVNIASDGGLEYAKRIDAVSKYKNKTISLTYKGEAPYREQDYDIDNIKVTVIDQDKQNKDYRYTNLMIYGADNLAKVEQFAALSFKTLGCTQGFTTDAKATTELKPNQAVFLITEKELDTLLENKSVNTELLEKKEETAPPDQPQNEPEQDPDPAPSSLIPKAPDEKTCAAPIVTGKAFADTNRLVITGVVEEGATVHASGGKKDVTYYAYDGIFLLDIECSGSIKQVELYASADGKNDSETVVATITKSMNRDYKGVCVGKDGHLHIDATMYDYLGTNLYSDSALANRKKTFERMLSSIQKVSPDTKLIIMIAPNHSTIYPETMPDWLQAQHNDGATSKLQQLYKIMEGSEVIFPNLTELLLSKKSDDYLLYQKTDTHWNELGAYYAYEYLMNEIIAKDFPAATATPLSEFDIFRKNVSGGDLLNFFGLNLDLAREIAVYVRPKTFTPITGYDKPYRMNFENIWTSDTHVFTQNNPDLPTMLMYRDSFSTNLINLMAQNFSESYFTNMWTYTIDYDYIKDKQPDYVILEAVERNIDAVG